MNPSTSGWIKKFEAIKDTFFINVDSFSNLYENLRNNGFLYGYSLNTLIELNLEQELSQEEIEKFNFLTSLYFIYRIHNNSFVFHEFIISVLTYFKTIEAFELSLWDKFIAGKDKYQQLERIIHEHSQIDQNIFLKQFSKSTTNSLLFIDVLAYEFYLSNQQNPQNYIKDLEYVVININNDIDSFKKANKQSFKNPLHILTNTVIHKEKVDLNYRHFIESHFGSVEKKYFLDLALIRIWEPLFTDDKPNNFIKALGIDMNINTESIEEGTKKMVLFYEASKNSTFFKSSNYLNNFYDNTSQLVIKLIKRNSKRIIKEISQSKELMILLSQSTIRDLTIEEQEKVQFQLLDILKTIPSLAIFLLPGGAILLPIFAKLLPNLLPSAFDDNKVD